MANQKVIDTKRFEDLEVGKRKCKDNSRPALMKFFR